jgi:hypothetical protein
LKKLEFDNLYLSQDCVSLHGLSRVSPPGYRCPGGFTLNSFKIKYIILSEHTNILPSSLSIASEVNISPYVPEEGRGHLGEFIIIELQIGVYIDNGV